MVLGALFNVGASFMNSGAGSGWVEFFHGFQVAIMATVMFNLTQFTYWTCKNKFTGSFLQVHTPTLLVLASSILVNIQPLCILVIGSWKYCCAKCEDLVKTPGCTSSGYTYPPWPGSGSFRECPAPGGNLFWDSSYCTGGQYPIFPTVASGWAIQIICTWGGFVLMFVGIMKATQLHLKLRGKWRQIRRQQNPRSAAVA
jgi:hypothetical protein